jgi:hypothetical protein
MDWLEKRFNEFKKSREERNAVVSASEDIYADVWGKIVAAVQPANTHGARLVLNGFPLHYVMRMGDRNFSLVLADDKCSIEARFSDAEPIIISLRMCEDGTVCLRCVGATLTPASAAQLIMERFLFEGGSPFVVPIASGTD